MTTSQIDPLKIPGYRKGRRCANCEAPVSDKGRSKSGEYFCARPDCRLERNARRMARYRLERDEGLRRYREQFLAVDTGLPQLPPELYRREDIERWQHLVEVRRQALGEDWTQQEVDEEFPVPPEWR